MIKKFTLTFILLASTLNVWCQVSVTGIVISKDDKYPFPGVNVIEKGTRNGTATAKDGTFSIYVTNPNAILVISFIGYITQEISLKGRSEINIVLKPDCNIDWFDAQKIGFYVNSGLINNPLGGQFELTFPAFVGQAVIKSGISYQTDLENNKFLNTQIELKHLFVSCDFDMDVKGYYREVSFDTDFNSKTYSFETDSHFNRPFWNIRHLTFIAGYSHLDFRKIEPLSSQSSSGPVIGLGTWVGRRLGLYVIGKAAVFKNKTEYQGQINREFRKINTFIKFYKLDSFAELSVGIGTEITYRFKKQSR